MIEPMDIEGAESTLRKLLKGYQENLTSPFMLASESTLRVKDKKLLQKHVNFIVDAYHDYLPEVVQKYLEDHAEFKSEIMDRVLDNLMEQSSLLIDRFIDSVTEKEAIGYLYFYLQYVELIAFTKPKELK